MIKSLSILGRLPDLGVAELETLYGNEALTKISNDVVGLNLDVEEINFNRLGGSVKLCQVISEQKCHSWEDIEKELIENSNKYVPLLDSGKTNLGLSLYGINVDLKNLRSTALKLKKIIKNRPQSIRIVPNQSLSLSSAQVFHNNLTRGRGIELVIIYTNQRTFIAKTSSVQNINAYSQRDQARPKRDSRVGMLPPRLAQILINLAHPKDQAILLDPFCGTGVILQEAGLMGLKTYGTDIEPRMIEYAEANLDWLKNKFDQIPEWFLEPGDATSYQWQPFDSVASEIYLGQAFSSFPAEENLKKVINTCNLIAEKFLKNIYSQIGPDQHLSLALPAWRMPSGNGYYHLPLVDSLLKLGYNRVSFSHVRAGDLIYYRPEQIVARELIVIKKAV